jgi:hypothetical protein
MNENIVKVAYIWGILDNQLHNRISNYDLEELIVLWSSIANEWSEGIGKGVFKDIEEVGYITAYARRVILERYGKWK